jgi:hypothetical protein
MGTPARFSRVNPHQKLMLSTVVAKFMSEESAPPRSNSGQAAVASHIANFSLNFAIVK